MEAVKPRKKHRNKHKRKAPAAPTTATAPEETEAGVSGEGSVEKSEETEGEEASASGVTENISPDVENAEEHDARPASAEPLCESRDASINQQLSGNELEQTVSTVKDNQIGDKQIDENIEKDLETANDAKSSEINQTEHDIDINTERSTVSHAAEGSASGEPENVDSTGQSSEVTHTNEAIEQDQPRSETAATGDATRDATLDATLDATPETEKTSSDTDVNVSESNVSDVLPSAPPVEEHVEQPAIATHEITSEAARSAIRLAEEAERAVQEQRTMYPKLDSLITQEIEPIRYERMAVAFTEDQLKMFYYNPLLKELEGFTEHFLRISKQDDHEFYELVNNYFKSRNALAMAFKEYEIVEQECNVKKDNLWVTKDLMISAQGKCKDNVAVTHNQQYQQVELNRAVPLEIDSLLKTIEKALHETLCLQMYSSQLARLRVSVYIYELLNNSTTLCSVRSEAPVGGQCPSEITPEFQSEVQKLRNCISVLFMFVRRPQQDQEFADNLNTWLEQLVSVLLRVASLADLVFLVNHIMRCPPGFATKAAHFIQFPIPRYHANMFGEQYFWDNPLIHHFVAVLADILHPVKGREEFLENLFIGKQAAMRSLSWTLVDEDGEEDEDPENSWMLFQEGDLAAVFAQFPFDAVFKHLFKMDPQFERENLSDNMYTVESTTSRDVMRMLAFASCIVNIMGYAFSTYQKVRYRAFIKRVGRTIRQVVQYVLDHWSNYRSWRVNVCGDAEKTIPNVFPVDQQLSIERLQTEVDQLFMRAAQQIVFAHRLGAWQFLADMPFNSVSTRTLWRLFWALHTDINNMMSLLLENGKPEPEMGDWRAMLQDRHGEFTDQLAGMSQSEAVFLLTTFANMATSRESSDRDFIEAIALEVYEVSFLTSQTREFCSKTGRDLLGTISASHPFVISVLLNKVSDTIDNVGKASVYLFSGLPVHLWHPCSADMDLVRSWLLKADLTSPQHQLARFLLRDLDWGCAGEEGENTQLFLSRSWHRAVAVMLVEVSALRLPLRPGGIAHENFNADASFLQQVTHIATSSYNRLMQQNHEQTLYDWLWEVAVLLRLHEVDLPTPVMSFRNRTKTLDKFSDSSADTGFAGLTRALSSDEPIDMNAEHSMVNVVNGVKAKGPLACYVAIAMTAIGVSPDLFITEGLDYLTIMINERCFEAALRLFANTMPMFLPCQDKLVQEQRFTNILHRLCQLDGEKAGYAEKLLLYPTAGEFSAKIAGVIQSHIQQSHFRGSPGPLSVVELWTKALCSLPNWYRDGCIQYLLNSVMMSAIRLQDGLDTVQTQLMEAYKVVLKTTGEQGLIASIFSMVTFSSTEPPFLWEIKAKPDYSYYAYCVLAMEDQMEENAGLRMELSKVLEKKDSCTIDHALKKVTKKMKLRWTPQASRLAIYRWANQALLTDMDHPALPLIWQRFFKLYLERPRTQPGLPQREGVGYRYFDSQADVSLLKKMKQRLQTTAEHHKSITAQTRTDQAQVSDGDTDIDKQFEEARLLHDKLAMFYQTLVLWLDEPRLHDPNLYLPSLPPPYDPHRLETLLKPEHEPWQDLIHARKMDWEVREVTGRWMKQAHGTPRRTSTSLCGQWSSKSPETAAARIIRRMKNHQQPQAPPPVEMPKAPLPPTPDSMLRNKQKVLGVVQENLQNLVNHARKSCREADHHVALDREYIDQIPRMYSNEMQQIVLNEPCRSKFRAGHQCAGPAKITIRFLAKHENEIVVRRVTDNRQEYDKTVKGLLQPCPMDICSAAAHVEMIITCLIKMVKSSGKRKSQEIISDIGTSLFYRLAATIDESCLRYQPTTQFFTSCIEILGKEFILNTGSQTEQLLYAILEHTSITMLLVPFFCPNDNPERFTAMYHEVLQTVDKDLAFSLLTKFDLQQWLSSPDSSLIERSGLTSAVINSLSSHGFEPEPEVRTIIEVYLRHMSQVLMYNFPEQYSDMLRLICEASSRRSICLEVWNTFLDCIGCVPLDDTQNAQRAAGQLTLLADQQVIETLTWLTQYFAGQRAELGGHVTGGIYTLWRPYIKQLSFMLGFLCQRLVVTSSQQYAAGGQDVEKGLQDLWKLICSAFEPWICSQDSPIPGNPPVAPWNESEVPQASDMVALFTDTIGCLHTHFPIPHSGSSLMNLFWPFFVKSLVKTGIPDYVRRVYHSKFFSLPWDHFLPTLNNIELMVELLTTHSSTDKAPPHRVIPPQDTQQLHAICETSFQFLGCVFPLMKWSGIITAYCESQTPETISRLHGLLFHLFVMLANQKIVVQIPGSTMPALLEESHYFPWHYISTRSYDEVLTWQVNHCDAELILKQNSIVWHAIRLIRAAAGILVSPEGTMQPTHPDTVPKRASYVRCITSLLVNCSTNAKLAADLYPPVIEFVLRDIECIAGSGVDPASTASEVCLMLSETLNLLNNCSPVINVADQVLKFILNYLKTTTCSLVILASIPASCRTLANLSYMVAVLETGITEFLGRQAKTAGADTASGFDGGWGQIAPSFSVPELAQDSFIEECIQQSSFLTLYTYVLLRLSQCDSTNQEMSVMTDMVSWCGRMKIRREYEDKVPLFWHKILQLALRQADYSGHPLHDVAKQLSFLTTSLHQLGEDKDSSGLLGAIGFGKKSAYTVKFRFLARVVEAFILAQLPSNHLLRLEPKAPGYVREPNKNKQKNESGRTISSTNEAESALAALEALRGNKQYSQLANKVTDMHTYIANPLNSLRDGPVLVARLTMDMFPEQTALRIMK